MRVKVRFVCVDLPNYTGIKEIELPEGATVEQAVMEYAELFGMDDAFDKLPDSMFLIGKQSAQLDTILRENEELAVIRIMGGG